MTVSTNVTEPTLGTTGFVAPGEDTILTGVWDDLQAAFGGTLTESFSTPQGQIAQSLTAIIGDKNAQFLDLVNNVDPSYASGRMQDGIGRIYFITRRAATATAVSATCSGLTGAVIPAGSIAQDTAGYLYESLEDVTIPASGGATVTFQCTTSGPVSCPIGALSTIYKAVPGWDSITNAAAGVEGQAEEGRAAFEARRQESVALNSTGACASVLGAVLSVDDVIDAYVTENTSSSTATIGGVSLMPHSLYVAVYGGAAADIAKAIWTKKAPGCDYNGNTSISVQDTSCGYAAPYPTYTVTFTRPTETPVLFAVSIASSSSVPSDAAAQIQAAIISAFNGNDGGIRQRIGSTVYASRYYAGVAVLGAWARIVSIKVGIGAANADSAALNINQIPTVDRSNITVTMV